MKSFDIIIKKEKKFEINVYLFGIEILFYDFVFLQYTKTKMINPNFMYRLSYKQRRNNKQ